MAGRTQWEAIASLAAARRSEGFRVLLVCSAVVGETNRLSELAAAPDSTATLDDLLEAHRALGRDLEVEERQWLPAAERLLEQCLCDLREEPGPRFRAALLAMGEWLSTTIGSCFLGQSLDVAWVDVRDVLTAAGEKDLSLARRWLSASCQPGEDPDLAERWSGLSGILVTQGFVVSTWDGSTALLGRGGSDTSAALLAGRLVAERLEIWTDVPGLFSADPRLISDARLLTAVDYAEALEMAASGAKVVQARCIRAAAATQTPVVIRDVNRRSVPGTRIDQGLSGGEGIKTVTCQENMVVILLQNLDARYQVGFLADVFEIFRHRGISIDLVATSETTTTVAINCEANHLGPGELEELVDDLTAKCRVTLFRDCVCVNLVGRGVRTVLHRLHGVLQYFEEHPLLMVSQSANDLCLSLLVRAGDHEALLRGAHRALVPQDADGQHGVFGASWKHIQEIAG